MSQASTFAYDRSEAPMMWVMFVLSLLELAAVHLLVATNWPLIGWPLTILSVIGAVWLLVFIRSLRSRPHRLEDHQLVVQLGNLTSLEIPLDQIEKITGDWEPGATGAKDARDMTFMAHPNRCLMLNRPLPKGRSRVFIRLDWPQAFDAALAERGVIIS